jgi:hypothetical protein
VHGVLVCTVPLQPTPASRTYIVRLTHRHGAPPQVDVIEPKLDLHLDADALPHIYRGDRLCLYYSGEWDDSRLLSSTVLPWASEWLLHYELWLTTATWHGGGRHTTRPDIKPDPQTITTSTALMTCRTEIPGVRKTRTTADS